jgi:hypothetical protein
MKNLIFLIKELAGIVLVQASSYIKEAFARNTALIFMQVKVLVCFNVFFGVTIGGICCYDSSSFALHSTSSFYVNFRCLMLRL